MRLIIVGPNLLDQSKGDYHVHADGCGHLSTDANIRYEDQSWTGDYSSRVEVADDVYPPADFDCDSGAYVDTIYFAPCTRGLA